MAGLLDSVFDPRQYAGLLGDLQRWQRTPEQAQQAFEQPTSTYAFGGQMVPVYGQAPSQPEVSSQSRMPQAQAVVPPAAPQPEPQVSGADRMKAALGGFIENAHTGPMGALMGGFMGATTGEYGSRENLTIKALMAKGLDRDTARAAAKNPQLMSAVVPQLFGTKDKTDDIREFEYAKGQGFNGSLEQWMQRKRAGGGEYGLNPVWGRDKDGNPVMLQAGKSGDAIQTKLPPGVTLSGKEPIKMDAGTHYVLMDPLTRQVISTIPKDLRGAEREKKIGDGEGDAAVSLESVRSKMPGLEKVVADLEKLSETATYTMAGQGLNFVGRQLGFEPREAAIARTKYIATVDNQVLPLLRDTFGAAFTVKEGETLRNTLGDPDKSPKEKQAVLNAFIEQKRRDVETMEGRAGRFVPAQPSSPAQTQSPAPSNSGWKIERLK